MTTINARPTKVLAFSIKPLSLDHLDNLLRELSSEKHEMELACTISYQPGGWLGIDNLERDFTDKEVLTFLAIIERYFGSSVIREVEELYAEAEWIQVSEQHHKRGSLHVQHFANGWHWYATVNGHKSSSYFGPFSSASAAMNDCDTAHKS